MPPVSPELHTLPHAVFLRRVSTARVPEATDSRLGQGAFLALRLIDLLAPETGATHPDAFEYQWSATERFCRGLGPSPESAHLRELVSSAIAAYRTDDISLVTPAFFAYAHFLEDALYLDEALDVLDTLRRIAGPQLSRADGVALYLREGRVNRKLNRFDAAEASYLEACTRARAARDAYSELLGRIGRANTFLGRGNLPECERQLTEVLRDAHKAGLREAEARAEHGLGAVLHYRGSPDLALKHTWRAFELYEENDSQLRALGDVGLTLLMLGDATGARRALQEVVRRAKTRDVIANAQVELMHCASYERDRFGFERWRARCEDVRATMPPNILADFYLKAGIGEARFGLFRRATASLEKSLDIAEQAELNALVFTIERIKDGLPACEKAAASSPFEGDRTTVDSDELREVSASLAQLVSEPA